MAKIVSQVLAAKENRKSSIYGHEWGKIYLESFMPSSEDFIVLESELMSNHSSLHMPEDFWMFSYAYRFLNVLISSELSFSWVTTGMRLSPIGVHTENNPVFFLQNEYSISLSL